MTKLALLIVLSCTLFVIEKSRYDYNEYHNRIHEANLKPLKEFMK